MQQRCALSSQSHNQSLLISQITQALSQMAPSKDTIPFGYTMVTTEDGRTCLIPDAMVPAGEMAFEMQRKKRQMGVESAAGGVCAILCNINQD